MKAKEAILLIEWLQKTLTSKTFYLTKAEELLRSYERQNKDNVECDCVIPKPIDAYHDIDKHICRDCNSIIKQTED